MFHLCQSYRLSSSLSCKYKEIRAGCGISAVPGSARPSASAMICIVEAVPIKEHAPQLGQALHFAQSSFSSSISPRSNFALYIPSCSSVSISDPHSWFHPEQTRTEYRLWQVRSDFPALLCRSWKDRHRHQTESHLHESRSYLQSFHGWPGCN